METTIILLALFGIKHFIADFVLQYPYMLGEKGIYGARGGIDHAMIHAMLTAFVIAAVTDHWFYGLLLGGLDGVLHYHIDWAKQQLNRGLTAADRKFWILLGADQGLHYLTYIGIIAILVL